MKSEIDRQSAALSPSVPSACNNLRNLLRNLPPREIKRPQHCCICTTKYPASSVRQVRYSRFGTQNRYICEACIEWLGLLLFGIERATPDDVDLLFDGAFAARQMAKGVAK